MLIRGRDDSAEVEERRRSGATRRTAAWPTTSQTLHAVVEGLEAAGACFAGVPRVAIALDLDQVNVDVQRLCPLNSSAKMSSRAGRCSVDDAAPWRLGGPPARR